MSAGEHTPGPWTPFILDKPMADIPAYVAQCIEASQGAEFFFIFATAKDGPVDVCHVGNGPRREANARLIAASPEMLEALQAEQEWRDREAAGALDPEWDYEFMVGRKRRAAIAKATGGAA